MDVTLLEVSLDDAEITANAPFSGMGSSGSAERSSSRESAPEADAEEIEIETGEAPGTRSGSPPIKQMLALAALFVLAVLARRAMSSRDRSDEV